MAVGEAGDAFGGASHSVHTFSGRRTSAENVSQRYLASIALTLEYSLLEDVFPGVAYSSVKLDDLRLGIHELPPAPSSSSSWVHTIVDPPRP